MTNWQLDGFRSVRVHDPTLSAVRGAGAEASNSIEQAKHGGDDSSRPAQLQARENEQKALSLWIKGAAFQQIAAGAVRRRRQRRAMSSNPAAPVRPRRAQSSSILIFPVSRQMPS